MKTVRTLGLAGFNRHGDLPVMERWLDVDAGEWAALEGAAWHSAFDGLLASITGQSPAPARPDLRQMQDPCLDGAQRLAAGTIALQQAAGFRVSHHGALAGSDSAPIRLFAEYDLEEAGIAAVDLAADLLAAVLAGEALDDERLQSLRSRYRQLPELARLRATPADARALIDAARERGIPFYRMDREPYEPVRGSFRLRGEGLLRLGQACHQRTLDGNFCIERSAALHGLAKDRSAMFNCLQRMQFPLPLAAGRTFRQCTSPNKTARTARQTGFPVVLKTVQRREGGVVCDLRDETAVVEAAKRLLTAGAVFVEPSVDGEVVELLYVGQRRFAALRRLHGGGTERVDEERVPADALSAIDDLAANLELVCLSVAVALGPAGAARRVTVLDVDPAPRLDRLLQDMPDLLGNGAGRMLEWLFPARQACRIPVAAITGTNGKTTTCFMLERIMREADFRTGMACSTGSYFDGGEIGQYEVGYLPGHLTVLDKADVTLGVLETTRGGAMSTGIGFDRCTVAACLNVGNDHLDDDMGIRTLDEMAQVKQWIVERGERVVLNADDPRCRAMAEALGERRPVLVSCESNAAELRSPTVDTVWVVETIEARDWIVLHDGPSRLPVVAVDEVPATYGGRAGHNTANALHAAAIAHVMGADRAAIAAGLSALRPDAGAMPARLNHYCCDGIDIVVDYAHNPDGLARLADFCDRFEVGGRRIIAVSLPVNRGEAFVREGVAEVAGHFDHYICKNYRIRYGREPHEVPQLLRSGLVRAGVPADRTTLVEDEDEAISRALEMGRPGDLVVLVVGKSYREQIGQVEAFVQQRGGASRVTG